MYNFRFYREIGYATFSVPKLQVYKAGLENFLPLIDTMTNSLAKTLPFFIQKLNKILLQMYLPIHKILS